MPFDVSYHVSRLESLAQARMQFDAQWAEAARRLLPDAADAFVSPHTIHLLEGQKRTASVFDTSAALALSRFSAVMESLLTPQASRWHRLVPADKTLARNRTARDYLDTVVDLLFTHRYRTSANFVANSQQVFASLGAFGNGVLFVDANDVEPGLRYKHVHLAEVYFQENFAGVVDTVYRRFFLSPRQIAQRFPDAPKEILADADRPDEHMRKRAILHVVTPRQDFDPSRRDPKGKRFLSAYVDIETRTLLEESGYDKFPFAVARYTQAPGEVYGRGPAQLVLPSIKGLNEQKKVLLKQAHRAVDPVLFVHDDGVLDTLSLRAGAVNKGGVSPEGNLLVHSLPVGRLDIGLQTMELERMAINDAFLLTLFQVLVETPSMTATEVLERTREKGMLIAPIAGRLQAEFLGPLIERELDLLFAQDLLPPPPPVLQGAEFDIEYDAPLSRMQRSERAAGFLRALSVAMDYVRATGDPSPLDHFDFDAAMPEIIDIYGGPSAWVRPPDAVAAVRASRAQSVAQEQAVASAPAVASLLKGVDENA
jgi:hypothetical protein